MRKSHLLTGALAALGLYSVSAQELSIDAEIRPRFEYRHGFIDPIAQNVEPAAFVSQRSALKFAYKTETIKTFLQLQDVSVWGDRAQLAVTDGDSFRVQQAWADLNLGQYVNGLSLKLGRQELSYDDQRILGGLGWAQQARTHDVAKFSYKNEGLKIDAGFGWNQNSEKIQNNLYTPGAAGRPIFQYKTISFLHINNKFSDKFNGSFLFLGNTFQDSSTPNDVITTVDADGTETAVTLKSTSIAPSAGTTDRYTSGVHLNYKSGAFGAAAKGYYQFGSFGNDDVDQNGFLAGIDLTYKPGKTLFGLGYEFISGDDKSTTDEREGFFPLFGTNHKFNGFMDFFYVGRHNNNVGLQDINAKAVFKTGEKSTLMVKLHQFLAAEDSAPAQNIDASGNLGTEVDLVFKTPVVKGATLVLGYSQAFLSDEFLDSRNGVSADSASDIQQWGWAMLIIKPNLFKWNKEK